MPEATATVESLRANGALSALDWHFARVLGDMAGESDESVRLAAALVSRAVSRGHVCLDLSQLEALTAFAGDRGETVEVALPNPAAWRDALSRSPMVGGGEVGAPPLVLHGQRLYTLRYWRYECDLARRIGARCSDIEPASGAAATGQIVDRLFGPRADGVDWQRVAALVALHRKLCVISGGPGTGKTHTVANLLALLAEDHRQSAGELPEVMLLAPTGKAANRLGESLRWAASRLPCDDEILDLVRTHPMTIHRALRREPRTRSRFLHDASNPLVVDIVVVDEASMVDVGLMSRLMEAIPSRARVVLLGDRDQLASVEAGAILADLCGDAGRFGYSERLAGRLAACAGGAVPAGGAAPAIRDSVVTLTRNYRYGESSGIGRVAAAINAGDAAAVLEQLTSKEVAGVSLQAPLAAGPGGLLARVASELSGLFTGDAESRLAALTRFRVLCALRRGPYGVEELNRLVEATMRAGGLIEGDDENYHGRPIMVVQNDAETGLFNGDVGVLTRADSGGMRANFPEAGGVRSLSLGRLPAFETVYATTIHKSQGSEFDEVAVVLPDEPSPILTRELLYTAVTRAKSKVVIHAAPEILELAIGQRVERASGLRERLWGEPASGEAEGGQLELPGMS